MEEKEKENLEKLGEHSKTMLKDGRSYGIGLSILAFLLGLFYIYMFFLR